MTVYSETIALEDKVSGPAREAAGAMSMLQDGLLAAKQSLVAVPAAATGAAGPMAGLGGAAFDAANAMAVGKETITAAVSGIANAFRSLAAGDVRGAVDGLTEGIAGAAKALDLVVPGLGQAVSMIVKIAGGFVGITAGLIQSGAELAIEATTSKQAMLGFFDAMEGGVASGAQVEGVIDGVKARLGVSKDALIDYTKRLEAMGITDLSKLEQGMIATASANALLGDKGVAAFDSLTKKIQGFVQAGQGVKLSAKGLGSLAEVGLTVADVAGKMGISQESLAAQLKAGTANASKFGDAMQLALIDKGKGALDRMANSLPNLKKLFQESIGDMFEDFGDVVAPFLKELRGVVDVFGAGSESGKTMKAAVGGAFRYIFSVVTPLVPMVKHFLLDMVVLGLKAYIGLKPLVAKFREWLPYLAPIWTGIKTIAVIVGAAVAILVASVAAFVAPFIALGLAVIGAIGYLEEIGETIFGFVAETASALADWVSGAATAAADFVAGLVSGIANGAGMVVGAAKGLATGAMDAITSTLGIASPSKVMMQFGAHTGAGFAAGMDAKGPDVHGSASGLASAAMQGVASAPADAGGVKGAPGAAGAPGVGGGGSGGVTVNVGGIVIQGAGRGAEELTEEAVSLVFERAALEAGV